MKLLRMKIPVTSNTDFFAEKAWLFRKCLSTDFSPSLPMCSGVGNYCGGVMLYFVLLCRDKIGNVSHGAFRFNGVKNPTTRRMK